MIPVDAILFMLNPMDMGASIRDRIYSNPIPQLRPSDTHTSYAQNKRNSKKIKNRKRQKK